MSKSISYISDNKVFHKRKVANIVKAPTKTLKAKEPLSLASISSDSDSMLPPDEARLK